MAREGEVKAFYEEFARRVQLGDFLRINRRLEAIQRFCDDFVRPGARVLEVGCGTGIVSRHLLRRASHLLALDLSEAAVAVAHRHAASPRAEFRVLDVMAAEAELTAAGPFDAIVLADVIEHLPPAARPALFARLEGVLAADGVMLLTWPSPEYQEYLRTEEPEALQVIDETVEVADLLAETSLKAIYYRLCDIWCRRQYAHLALARRQPFAADVLPRSAWARMATKVRDRLWRWRNRALLKETGDAD